MKKIIFLLVAFITTLQSILAEIPDGYYNPIEGKVREEIMSNLKPITKAKRLLTYGSGPNRTWSGFFITDNIGDSVVWDMYSNIIRKFTTSTASVSDMNIEHSFPKSWWDNTGTTIEAYKDLHHLNPSDAAANRAKSNFPLGEVEGVGSFNNQCSKVGVATSETGYTDTKVFEPADEYKGDFARMYMYIVTRYIDLDLWHSPMIDEETYPSYPVYNDWSIRLLIKWHRQDPVSTKEIDRNEAIYSIQGNRNPYIDYPVLAEHIWGDRTDIPFMFPTNIDNNSTLDFIGNFQNGNLSLRKLPIGATLQLYSEQGVLLHNSIVSSPALEITLKQSFIIARVISNTNIVTRKFSNRQ